MYQQYQPGPPPGFTAIAVTARYSWLTFLLGLFKPQLILNGYPVAATWGRTVIPVPPGQHHVHMHVPYWIPPRIGSADFTAVVHPGQVVELEYRAPVVAFLGGSLGAPPQKYRGTPALVAIMAFTLVLIICLPAALIAIINQSPDDDRSVAEPARTTPSTRTPSRGGTTTTAPADKPTLQALPPRKLIGPVFGTGEDTYPMGFAGWPFAFRTPGTWGCISGRVNLPDAQARVCIDEDNPGGRQRVNIMLRPCPAPCGTAERKKMDLEWFEDDAPRVHAADKLTAYVETKDTEGRYVLHVSHYFAETPGATPTWEVGVSAIAPPATKADVQKVANDILSQTPN